MPPTKGIKTTKQGFLLIGSDTAKATDSIKIPQQDTSYGAGFGDTITDSDRAFAAEREPVAHFLTYGIAADITEKWFTIGDPDTTEADPELDRTAQEQYNKLNFKKHLTELVESARTFGEALLVGGFSDAQTIDQLKKPITGTPELMQLHVYPSIKNGQQIKKWEIDLEDKNPSSPRYGEPVIYKLHRGAGNDLLVHYTRIFHLKNSSNCASVLDSVWDDIVCGRNIRWGASQWMYRVGSGFPVIGFPAGTTAEQLEAWATSGAFDDIMSRTGIFVTQNSQMENNGMTFKFEGPAGHTLDPTPFFSTNDEQIAKATGIPKDRLVGAQAGAVTGSEVNMQDYYKVISREQAEIEPAIRWVTDKLSRSGQLTLIKATVDKQADDYQVGLLKRMLRRVTGRDYRHKTATDYEIEWNSAFELSAIQEADVELKKVQTQQARLDYMTIDEVRALDDLDPLPNGEGAKLKQASMGLFGENKGEEGNEELAGADKFLVVDLKRQKKEHKHE